MAETTAPLWVPNHDYMPAEDRSAISALRNAPGCVGYSDFKVAPTSPPSWNVTVAPGRAVVDGSVNVWTQGSYVCYAPDEKTVPVLPSDPTLDRLDIVVLHVYDQDTTAEQGYRWEREVIAGTPGSGAPPAKPPNSLLLQGLNVKAGSASVDAATLASSDRPWRGDFRTSAGTFMIQAAENLTLTSDAGVWVTREWDWSAAAGAFRDLVSYPFESMMHAALFGVFTDATVVAYQHLKWSILLSDSTWGAYQYAVIVNPGDAIPICLTPHIAQNPGALPHFKIEYKCDGHGSFGGTLYADLLKRGAGSLSLSPPY